MSEDKFNAVMHDMWTSNISESLSCKNSSFHNDVKNPHHVKFGILLAQRHGGSNWIISELYKYKISVHGELLLHWENHECSRFSQYMELTACNELSLINELDTIYLNYIEKHVRYQKFKKIKTPPSLDDYKFMFWKIQIGQIPPYLFKTLIDYIYCHNIMVLHIVREASVASFWSIQAQTVERIYTLNPDKFFKMNHHGLVQLDGNERINALELDSDMTLRYVINVDTNRKMLSKLIKIYPGYIKYQQYDYEDLIGPYSDRYWSSVIYWIGGESLMLKKRKKVTAKKYIMNREHPMACFTKITNWNEIKQVLKGTDSYFACEKYHS